MQCTVHIDVTGALHVQVFNDVTAMMDGMFLTKDGAMGQLRPGETMPEGAKVGVNAAFVHTHDTSLHPPRRLGPEGEGIPGSQQRSLAQAVGLPSGQELKALL